MLSSSNRFYNVMEVNSMQKLCVYNGKVWEKSVLHLKSAIPKFSKFNIVKQVELDLLQELFRK